MKAAPVAALALLMACQEPSPPAVICSLNQTMEAGAPMPKPTFKLGDVEWKAITLYESGDYEYRTHYSPWNSNVAPDDDVSNGTFTRLRGDSLMFGGRFNGMRGRLSADTLDIENSSYRFVSAGDCKALP